MTDKRRNQRIARLTPLTEVLAAIRAIVAPVSSRMLPISEALGSVLAQDIQCERPVPAVALALRDGFAVAADATVDASAYAPVLLAEALPIETGAALPRGTDAIATTDQVTLQGGIAQILAPVAPGDGVLAAGGDVAAGGLLVPRGRRLLHRHIAMLASAGISHAVVRRPHVRVVGARLPHDLMITAAAGAIAAAIVRAGGKATVEERPLVQAMQEPGADAVLAIGGTGEGGTDTTVATLAALGEIKTHGIAIRPGETAAFGLAGERPVLCLPGRLDAAIAVFALLGCPLVSELAGNVEGLQTRTARLTRKIASTPGVTELVFVRCEGTTALPIASGYVPLAALAQADGYVLVPPESEGYPPDSEVVIRPWP